MYTSFTVLLMFFASCCYTGIFVHVFTSTLLQTNAILAIISNNTWQFTHVDESCVTQDGTRRLSDIRWLKKTHLFVCRPSWVPDDYRATEPGEDVRCWFSCTKFQIKLNNLNRKMSEDHILMIRPREVFIPFSLNFSNSIFVIQLSVLKLGTLSTGLINASLLTNQNNFLISWPYLCE